MIVKIQQHGAGGKDGHPFFTVKSDGELIGQVIEVRNFGFLSLSTPPGEEPEPSHWGSCLDAMTEVLAQGDIDNHDEVAEQWGRSNESLFVIDTEDLSRIYHDEVAEWREYDNKQRLSEVA